jgi:ferredoxin
LSGRRSGSAINRRPASIRYSAAFPGLDPLAAGLLQWLPVVGRVRLVYGRLWNNAAIFTETWRETIMTMLSVEGVGKFEVPEGKRLVLALEQDAGIDQLHACGGNARCTTCRVEFLDGEPDRMTVAERDVLTARGLSGVRLSCQIVCDQDMTVRAISRLEGSGRKDVGHEPTADIQPPPEWVST